MENQHRKITGYRELTPVEIALMNDLKGIGNTFKANVTPENCGPCVTETKLEVMGKVDQYIAALEIAGLTEAETYEVQSYGRMAYTSFCRAEALASSDMANSSLHVQQAMMWAIRCVARPTTFC